MADRNDRGFLFTMNNLARDLPDGYQIIICVEKSSGWVDLAGPDGEDIEFPSNRETMLEQIDDAYNFACHLAAYGTAWKEHLNENPDVA